MTLKVVMKLNEPTVFGGWVESWYTNGSDPSEGLAVGRAGALATLRMRLSPPSVNLESVTLSDPSKFRVYTELYPAPGLMPSKGTFAGRQLIGGDIVPNDAAVELSIAVLFSIDTADHHHRRFLMRGLSETLVGEGNVYNPQARGWQPALTAWRNELLNAQWQLRSTFDALQPQNNFDFAPPGTALGVGTDRNLVISPRGSLVLQKRVGVTTPPMEVNDYFQVRGVRGGVNINGLWRIARIIDPEGSNPRYYVTYDKLERNLKPEQVTRTAVIVFTDLKTPQYPPITGVVDTRLSSRKTGRPTVLPRGRRRR